MYIKVLIIIISLISIISALWNISYSAVTFIATNLSIRESFNLDNNINNKGTHSGGSRYIINTRKIKYLLIKADLIKVFNAFANTSNIDPITSKYASEYKIINLLKYIDKYDGYYKKYTALYVPKSITAYWDLSCDSHFAPFVATSITNIALIDGLPLRKYSCYRKYINYGYSTYYINNIKAAEKRIPKKILCSKAVKYKFKRVIEIAESKLGNYSTITHEC